MNRRSLGLTHLAFPHSFNQTGNLCTSIAWVASTLFVSNGWAACSMAPLGCFTYEHFGSSMLRGRASIFTSVFWSDHGPSLRYLNPSWLGFALDVFSMQDFAWDLPVFLISRGLYSTQQPPGVISVENMGLFLFTSLIWGYQYVVVKKRARNVEK